MQHGDTHREGTALVAEVIQFVEFLWMGDAIVDEDHGNGTVHFSVDRFGLDVGITGAFFAQKDAFFVGVLGLVTQHQNHFAFDVEIGVVVIAIVAGADAVARKCERRSQLTGR